MWIFSFHKNVNILHPFECITKYLLLIIIDGLTCVLIWKTIFFIKNSLITLTFHSNNWKGEVKEKKLKYLPQYYFYILL